MLLYLLSFTVSCLRNERVRSAVTCLDIIAVTLPLARASRVLNFRNQEISDERSRPLANFFFELLPSSATSKDPEKRKEWIERVTENIVRRTVGFEALRLAFFQQSCTYGARTHRNLPPRRK